MRTGTLRLPVYGPLGNPDPALATTTAAAFLDSLLYSGLVKFGPDLHVIPELAVSIPTISTSGRTYTFAIRQDARFADGHRCTANDVAFSLNRALRLHARPAYRALRDIAGANAVWAGRATSLRGVRALNPLTLRIRLTHPDADFLQKLAFPVASVVDRHALRDGRIASWFQSPAGTGPFVVAGEGRDKTLLLAPRRHFYGQPIQLRSLQVVPVRSLADGLDLYHRGGVDAAAIPDDRYAALATSAEFHSSPALDAYYALPDGPGDPALAAELNRETLVDDADPALTPLVSIVPPAIPDYVSSPPQLTSLIPAIPSTIVVQRGNRVEGLLRAALYRQWGHRAGSSQTVRVVHVFRSLPDPRVWLRLALPETGSLWYRHVVARAATLTNDPVTRMSAYSRAETWALQEGLVIPLASGTISYLIKPSVQNLQVTPFGIMPANNNWATVSVT